MDGKEISRISITPAENGGHTVEHHFHPKRAKNGSHVSYQAPESHVFGGSEHKQMLSHISEALGLGGKNTSGMALGGDE